MIHTNNKEKYFFEINKDKGNLFYFNLKGEGDKILLKSGSFTQKINCQKGIKSVIRNSKNEYRFELEQFYDEKWIIILKAGNGKTIAVTTDLDTEKEAENFIEDLKNLSLKTPVIDKTK